MAKLNKTVIKALQDIQASGTVTASVGKPLLEQGLIEVNSDDVAAGVENARARLTQIAMDAMPKPKSTNNESGATVNTSNFAIIDNAIIPPSKRGAGRTAGPSKYPFDKLEPGKGFFVANSSVEGGNAIKTMGSAVTNATNKRRVDTGKTEQRERTKRGEDNKAALDAAGNNIKEIVTVPVYDYPVKFVIRSVKAGDVLGGWTAPEDGAFIARER